MNPTQNRSLNFIKGNFITVLLIKYEGKEKVN